MTIKTNADGTKSYGGIFVQILDWIADKELNIT